MPMSHAPVKILDWGRLYQEHNGDRELFGRELIGNCDHPRMKNCTWLKLSYSHTRDTI
jgi:hypothetical protein